MNITKLFRVLVATAPLSSLVAPIGAQTVWHVAPGVPGSGNGTPGAPFASIQDAIDAAAPSGDEVRIAPGTYLEHIDLLGKGLLVQAAAGPGTVGLQGDGVQSVVTLVNGEGPATVLRGLAINAGVGSPGPGGVRQGGGARLVGASARFEECEFGGNTADLGGSVYVLGGAPTFERCSISASSAQQGGGAYVEGAAARFIDCRVAGNLTGYSVPAGLNRGAGLCIVSALPGSEIVGSTVHGNRAALAPYPSGVGLYVSGTLDLRSTTVSANEAGTGGVGAGESGGEGMGLYAAGTVLVEDCVFEDNRRGFEGGAIRGDVVARRTVFRGNAAGFGGAVSGGTYEDCRFEANEAGFDGVFQAQGGAAFSASLLRCHIEGNRCVGQIQGGAGAFNCTLVDCLVLYNDANGGDGGGLRNCTATRCELVGNSASSGGGTYGGTLTDCRLIANEASVVGGAAAFLANLTRCELTLNRAPNGAAVHLSSLQFCTVSLNESAPGNSVLSGPGGSVRNSIVHGNTPAALGAAAGAYFFGYSLLESSVPGVGNVVADPLFLGPKSGDLRLSAGSPAIDAGDPLAAADPDGSRADMGAFPFDPFAVFSYGAYCAAKANGLGCLPVLAATGEPALGGPDDFAFVATELTGASFALATVGTLATAAPLAGGLVCVGSIQARLPVTPTGGAAGTCQGQAQFAVSHTLLAQLGVGTLGYAQVFFRDAQHPDGTGLAMTQGLEFRVRN